MIIVEKAQSQEFPFVLRVGDQEHPLTTHELAELHHCLKNCRDENAPEPECRCKLLAPWYSPLEEEERDEKRDRSSLWVGEKKWRITTHEEEDLLQNVQQLISEDRAGNGASS
jgi:hypothetical protein|tara:strand:+ start:299 stop:637 length:339 start_codon:yes stop_codon:yes gene_type:complete